MATPDLGAIAPAITSDTRPDDSTEATAVRDTPSSAEPRPFIETSTTEDVPPELLKQRICDLDLRIEGTQLGQVVDRFKQELRARGFTRLQPAFYLSSEWGVVEGTTAIAIPFYLADEQLRKVQECRGGIVEGTTDEDILRYLRHEFGHVLNYAYRLYETEEWSLLFGPMARPYTEEYRAIPFSPDYVRHLPGNYAQKHPDEDWAETFAVWMNPALDWRGLFGDAPGALKKLEYCDRTCADLFERDPLVHDNSLDEDVSTIRLTLEDFYKQGAGGEVIVPRSLDGDLRGLFAPSSMPPTAEGARMGSAAALLKRQQDALAVTVFRWTGVDPGVVRPIIGHLVKRAKDMSLTYPLAERDTVLIHVSAFLTTLAMNYVYKGRFIAT
ncbi:MAG: putative zinc-binding metallopeptidase [Planctomycetes bacterium]|nr:putative zinc-binding metallopeptidase [Planctomycetota bacterium]